jgi:hypothetical protein
MIQSVQSTDECHMNGNKNIVGAITKSAMFYKLILRIDHFFQLKIGPIFLKRTLRQILFSHRLVELFFQNKKKEI